MKDEEIELTTVVSVKGEYAGPKIEIHEGSGFSFDETTQRERLHDINKKQTGGMVKEPFFTEDETMPINFEGLPTPQSLSQRSTSTCSTYISLCDEDEICIDTDDSYTCNCKQGFIRNSKTNDCEDINECIEKSHKCTNYEVCVNEVGSYVCEVLSCQDGFKTQINSTIDNDVKCVDIDECLDEPCGDGKTCSNTQGSFECNAIDINGHHCEEGFELDDGDCIDINECKKGLCGESEICTNLNGSHRCEKIECEKGYAMFLKR